MGDMADYAIEDVIEFENLRGEYHSGSMADYEAYERGFLGPFGDVSSFAGEYTDYANVNTPESLEHELRVAESMLNGNSRFFSGLGYSFKTIRMTEDPPILSREEEIALFRRTLLEKYSAKFAEKMLDGFERMGIYEVAGMSKDELSKKLESVKNKHPLCYEGLTHILYSLTGSMLTGTGSVTKRAVINARKRENPTCNICTQEMEAKNGMYGKFYFCKNRCEGQKTVSDEYWQKFKNRVNSCSTNV